MEGLNYKNGDRIANRFVIESFIGRGATANVYKATDETLSREVALKIIPRNEALEERVKREIKTAASLNHPNVVTLHDFLVSDKEYIVVMEYVESVSLRTMLAKRGKIPYQKAVYIAVQVASALEAAHAKQIIHKDIKPENILITRDGKVKLTDFGIAFLISRKKELKASGTLGYMSPEQITGRYVDETTDIFALGVVLYEMLTGKNPFYADSLKESALKTLNYDPDPPHTIEPSVPEKLSNIVMKCIAKDPDFRFQSAAALKLSLIDFQKELVKIPEASKETIKDEKKPEKKRTDYELTFLKVIYVASLFFLVFSIFPFANLIKGLPGFIISSAIVLLGLVHPQSANWITALAVASLALAKNMTGGLMLLAGLIIYLAILSTYRRSFSAAVPFTEIHFSKLGIFPFAIYLIPIIGDTTAAFLGGLSAGFSVLMMKALGLSTNIALFGKMQPLSYSFDLNQFFSFIAGNFVALIEVIIIAVSAAFASSVKESIAKKPYAPHISVAVFFTFLTVAYGILNSIFKESTPVLSVITTSLPGFIAGLVIATLYSLARRLNEKK